MAHKRLLLSVVMVGVLVIGLLPVQITPFQTVPQVAQAAAATQPVVAIHVSELTQALESMPASPPTPTGTGYTGYEWFYTSWHYFVMYESLKIALESDGTPYVVVTDADIANNMLIDGGSPRYPIVFSLASEAVDDSEIQPLLDYVNAGGFLFVGSSSFTRNPNGTTRGNFALADEMGLNMSANTLQNWVNNRSFTHTGDHRLVSHIPAGTVDWQMLTNAEEIVWTTPGYQQLWRTIANGAEVIATAGGYPLLATNGYGEGRFIYHSIFNPIVGAGGQDSGMYAYTIYRNAVEWAFEAANLPIIKRSPWPFTYDAALMVRHDLENDLGRLGWVESSAQYEYQVGAKGDYYFCTGALRTYTGNQQYYIDLLTRAITNYSATIGSHNGGYYNPSVTNSAAYDYWHWGPDTMIDRTDFHDPDGPGDPYGDYADGYLFSKDSIRISFEDIEGWLMGTDNGRAGCGTAPATCPRTWASPRFDSGRDRSLRIFEELSGIVMGEQKVSPFPHWTLSYDPTNPDRRYAVVALPPSDWYVGSSISQSQESGHTVATIQALVDFYYQKGYLLNLYGHSSSTGGNMRTYVDYAVTKPLIWKTNAVGLYDWWVMRDRMVVTPGYTKTGQTSVATATIVRSAPTDPQTAIELTLPNWSSVPAGSLEVYLDGSLAASSEYRTTNYGVKVRVGTAVSNVEVVYHPLESWVQTNWVGGAGQDTWEDDSMYTSGNCVDTTAGQISLASSVGDPYFTDDFTRPPAPDPVPFTWVIPTSVPPATNNGIFNTTGATLNTSTTSAGQVGFTYPGGLTGTWTDYSVEADIMMPAGSTGGGGFAGRMNLTTGARYGIWIYPSTNTLRLVKFLNWSAWNSPTGLAQVSPLAGIGTGWHHIKMVFSGANIKVYVDNSPTAAIDVTDPGTYGGGVYTSGYVGIDYWSQFNNLGPSFNNFIVRDPSDVVLFEDNFGTVAADPLLPWTRVSATWTVSGGILQGTSTSNTSGNAYYQPSTTWDDYSVQGRIQFAAGMNGGGLGGRLDPATGTHYAAWIYPDGSSGGSNVIKLVKFRSWQGWSGTPMAQVSLSSVGIGWHTLRLDFQGARIRVYYDGNQVMDVTDNDFDGRAPYLTGGITTDIWTGSTGLTMQIDDVIVGPMPVYASQCALASSAFDGGVGVDWQTIGFDLSAPTNTGICVRTRTADRADHLAGAAWSDCYASGSQVENSDLRWIQYSVELTSNDPTTAPVFYENRVTYVAGNLLPGANLIYSGPLSANSETTVSLDALLTDDYLVPISDKTVDLTLSGPYGSLSANGVTASNGVASIPLDLMVAPGPYTLSFTFAGDIAYAPVSIQQAFTVTNPWQEWIQDSQTDFSDGSIGTNVEIIDPGSVKLLQQMTGGGEQTGPFDVGGVTYGYRHALFIDNPNTTDLPAGYSVKFTLDTAALVSADPSKLLPNGDDLRVFWDSGSGLVELDRLTTTAFNDENTELWFKLQADVPSESRNTSYFLYYGNPSAGTPPADPVNVWALWDDFDTSTLNSYLWNPHGTLSVSGGYVHLSAGAGILSIPTFTYAQLEMRLQTSGQDSYMWWGWEDGISDAPNFIVFEEWPSPTNLTALIKRNGAPYVQHQIADPPGGFTTAHTYTTDWYLGGARWLIDGDLVQTDTANVTASPMSANFNASQVAYDLDWVRARLRAAQEPVVSLSVPVPGYPSQGALVSSAFDTGQYSGWKYLVWDAVTPADTSVSLQVRTASTEAGLESAPWVNYAQPGMLITNDATHWIQYQATLTTNDSTVTPELQRVVIYYYNANHAPIAVDDIATTDEDTAVTINVLINDTDADEDSLTVVQVSDATYGALELNIDGTFTYTPDENYYGTDSFTYKVNDGTEDSNTATVSITVRSVNDAPVVMAGVDHTINEGGTFTGNGSFTDPDADIWTASVDYGEGAGPQVLMLSGQGFSLSNTYEQAGSYTMTVCVSDSATTICDMLVVTVTDVPPTVTLDKSVDVEFLDEPGGDFTFTFLVTNTSAEAVTITTLTDSQSGDADDFSICMGLIGTTLAAHSSTSCTYVVTHIDVAPGGGSYDNTAEVTVSDNEGSTATAADTQMVWVDDVRPTIQIEKLVDVTSLPEPGGDFHFTLKITNTSIEPVVLTQLTDLNVPAIDLHPYLGMWLQPGELLTINYTVNHADAMSYRNDASITVQDNEENYATATASKTVYITDVQPTISLVKSVDVASMPEPGGVFNFILTITNTSVEQVQIIDLYDEQCVEASGWVGEWLAPGQILEIDCPVEHLEAGIYDNTASITVMDNELNEVSAAASQTVTVTNVAPVLDPTGSKNVPEQTLLSFTATATDPGVPPQTLTFSLVGAPAGASITAGGAFAWTPTEAQGPGDYSLTVMVCDSYTPSLCDEEAITVSVGEVNVAPVLDPVGNQEVDEEMLLSFLATASDHDLPVQTLTFSLVDEPAGASIDPVTGNFTWSPTEDQGPGSFTFDVCVSDGVAAKVCETITVTVNEVNVAPVLDLVGNQDVNEEVLLTFTATARDVDVPAQTLTFSLAGDVPEGAAITSDGVFTWTPTEDQGPGIYTFDVCVSEGVAAPVCETIEVTVDEVNVAPVLDLIGSKTVNEETLLSFTATAFDHDLPVQSLVFSLVGAPEGATITSDGVFTWMPTETQGPGFYTFDVCVSDGVAAPVCETITVTVNEVNIAPVAEAGDDQTVYEGATVSFSGSFTDPDNGDTHIIVWSFGDGASETGTLFPYHVYADNGAFTVELCVTDAAGAQDCDSLTVTVLNVDPIAAIQGAPESSPEGTQIDLSSSVTDPGSADTFIYAWNVTKDGVDYTSGSTADFSFTPDDNGTYVVSLIVTDDDGGVGSDSETITVTNVNPDLSVDITTQTIQYSDYIAEVTFSATDVAADTLTATPDALPDTLSLNDQGCEQSDDGFWQTCTWTLEGTLDMPQGSYNVTITVADDDGGSDAKITSVTVVLEDATVAFDADNPVAVQVATPGGASGSFTLYIDVQEAYPYAGNDPDPGDISNAGLSLTLVPVGPGSPVSPENCIAETIGTGYDAVRTFACTFTGVPVNTYTAEANVTGGYYTGSSEDVLVVYDPSLGFTTGGGWFYWPGTNDKTNFGYTMKYNKKGGNVQGSLLIIRHLADGTIYRMKSNALYGLSLGQDPSIPMGWAAFSGKGTFLEPGWPEPVGNYEFTAYVEDRNEPGTGVDRFWIEVLDKDRIIEPELSLPRPGSLNAVDIQGGNLVVPHRAR